MSDNLKGSKRMITHQESDKDVTLERRESIESGNPGERSIPGPPRVAVIVISDLQFGGAQRQVVELCNRMDPQRYEMHIVSLAEYVPLSRTLKHAGSRLYTISKKNKWDFTVAFQLARLLRKLKADVVQGYLFDACVAARIAGKLAGTRLVVDSERNCLGTFKKRHHLAYRATRSFVDIVVANSSAGADFNHREFGLEKSRYRVVHNGVDTDRFTRGNSAELRRKLGWDEGDLVVGMFASFKRQKNHQLLLKAAPEILKKFPNARIALVGDELYQGRDGSGELKKSIEREIERIGMNDRFLFMGNRDDVDQIYGACDLTVLPSLHEGTPNVALESMASGVPVVATKVADNEFVIPDGRVGYLVDLDDHAALAERISCLLEDHALRRKLGEQARAWVLEEFSCQRLADKTADVFDQALRMQSFRP
jgi:glycosyltransferase involved in cell wall biosynthesis